MRWKFLTCIKRKRNEKRKRENSWMKNFKTTITVGIFIISFNWTKWLSFIFERWTRASWIFIWFVVLSFFLRFLFVLIIGRMLDCIIAQNN